jgi:transcriptional regulator with PAS, ATPase and Fis domain
MPQFSWEGGPLPASAATLLAASGWTRSTRDGDIRVLRAEVPPSRAGGPWLWLSERGAVTPAAIKTAVAAGALDVISLGAPGWEVRLLARLEESRVEEPALTPPPGFVAQSPAMRTLLRALHQAAMTSMPVLLTGETGTGKEVAARLVHAWSARREGTFVPINCAAIPDELMEGELFGYAKGAFSGAVRDYPGLVAAAEGGTVFLDEIDDTPFALQVKLLRVLEDRVISRLGENRWRRVDFRILAATNRDLRPLIAQGAFGADLYERLATVLIHLPPLRERLEDLPALVDGLIDRYYREDPVERRTRVRRITPEALALLGTYAWPGNVRELRNVIFGALVAKRAGEELLVSDLPRRLWETSSDPTSPEGSDHALEARIASGEFNLREALESLERAALRIALRRANGNAAEAARLLGEVGRGSAKDPGGTVRSMIKRLGI